jgi:Ser/Thr protein kinase RdoA (MazF antagonist)
VHEREGFVVTLWAFHEHEPFATPPAAYADGLVRLHDAYRRTELPGAIHFTERVAEARALVEADTAVLEPDDRALVLHVLERPPLGAHEQLLHGEPHPGNVLATRHGPLFIDLETCCRGPVELDLAYLPEEAAALHPSHDAQRLHEFRTLIRAVNIGWRCDPDDALPGAAALTATWLAELRALHGVG